MAGRPRLARPWRRRGRTLGASGKAEAVNLADHCVARNAAELRGDLTGGKTVRPEFLEELDPLVRPAHLFFSSGIKGLDGIQPRRRTPHGGARRVRVRDGQES